VSLFFLIFFVVVFVQCDSEKLVYIHYLLFYRTDKFQINTGNLGDLLKVSLRNDGTGDSADWHLEKVLVVDSNGNEYRFPANVWLSNEPGKQPDVMLSKGKHYHPRHPFVLGVVP